MRNALQVTAAVIVLAVALLADGLMDTLGPLGYLLTAGPTVAAAGVLVWLSNRPPKKENRPRGCNPRERQDQPERLTTTPSL